MLLAFLAGAWVRLGQLLTVASPVEVSTFMDAPASLGAFYNSRLGPAEVDALQSLGLSLRFYAVYLLTFEVGLALGCTLVGLFIFWRRSEGWLTLWMAAVLVLLGTTSVSPELSALATAWPGATLLYLNAGMVGMVSNLHVLFLAPDGRFVPRWTWRLAAGFTGAVLAFIFYAQTGLRHWQPLASLGGLSIALPAWLVLIGLGLLSQMYRYRHVSSPTQRQQTKWMVVGLAAVMVGILVNIMLLFTASSVSGMARVWCNLARVTLVNLCLAAFPICLAFSILRYRLWDIDLIIRRTLIYSVLTGALVLVYLSSVVVLQALVGRLAGEGQSPVVTVLSTLAIAALFVPLRRLAQDFIDRCFYRRKYDAARTLTVFGARLRDEVDLDRLSEHVRAVVQDTLQPSHFSLWLKPPARPGPSTGERRG